MPTPQEIAEAMKQQKCSKSTGVDSIAPEIWKHGTLEFLRYWNQNKLHDFKNTVAITLYNDKGIKLKSSNYQSITLFSNAGKIFVSILLNRWVIEIAKNHLPESKCSLGLNWSITNMIFALRLS